MMIMVITGSIIVLGMIIFLTLNKQPNKQLIKKIKTLALYLNKNLSLDDSYTFIELLRHITVELVELNKQSHFPKELHDITNNLLGFVLSIPRLEESESNSLAEAIHQIDKLMTTSQEAQSYLKLHLNSLITIVSKSQKHPYNHKKEK
ncbi:MAG: hypothetical protein ACRCS8_03375 [Brevinema sp.]